MKNAVPIVSNLAFDSVDLDNSNELDREELGLILKKVAQQIGLSPPSDDDIVGAMKELDSDSDGSVNKAELSKIINIVYNFML